MARFICDATVPLLLRVSIDKLRKDLQKNLIEYIQADILYGKQVKDVKKLFHWFPRIDVEIYPHKDTKLFNYKNNIIISNARFISRNTST